MYLLMHFAYQSSLPGTKSCFSSIHLRWCSWCMNAVREVKGQRTFWMTRESSLTPFQTFSGPFSFSQWLFEPIKQIILTNRTASNAVSPTNMQMGIISQNIGCGFTAKRSAERNSCFFSIWSWGWTAAAAKYKIY